MAKTSQNKRNQNLNDFTSVEITGMTNSTINTQQLFRHGMASEPAWWMILEGRIYIPRNGAGMQSIDVRSGFASEQFRLRLVF